MVCQAELILSKCSWAQQKILNMMEFKLSFFEIFFLKKIDI